MAFYVFDKTHSHTRLKYVNIRLSVVSVAQLVERRIVVPVVVGSIPIAHPRLANSYYSQIIRRETNISARALH